MVRRRLWIRRVAAVVAVAALVVLAVWRQDTVVDALDELRAIGRLDVVLLLAAWSLLVMGRAFAVASSIPGLAPWRAVMATEATAGVGNALPGGLVIGQAVRIAMCRSWGADLDAIAVSMLVTGSVTASVLWVFPVVALVPELIADPSVAAVAVVALAAFVVGVIAWAWLGALGRWRFVHRALERAVVAMRGAARAGDQRDQRDERSPSALVDALQAHGRRVWAREGGRVIAGGVVYQAGLVLVVLAAVHAVDVDGLSLWDAFRSIALVRVATWLLPTPGGLGTVDAGLTVALVDRGAGEGSALAVVVLYRTMTYALPMLSGLLGFLAWRVERRVVHRRERRQAAAS